MGCLVTTHPTLYPGFRLDEKSRSLESSDRMVSRSWRPGKPTGQLTLVKNVLANLHVLYLSLFCILRE